MFKCIEKYLYSISVMNWGFPYHILLALIGVQGFYLLSQIWFKNIHEKKILILCFLIVNAIGYFYELYQNSRIKQPDTRGDLIANLIGSTIGVLLYWLL